MKYEKGEKIRTTGKRTIWEVVNDPEHVLIEERQLGTTPMPHNYIFLHQKGIPTSFVKSVGEKTLLAKRVVPIPIEVKVRRVAKGSYLTRYPFMKDHVFMDKPRVEFFLKDGKEGNPVIIPDREWGIFRLYKRNKLPKFGCIGEVRRNFFPFERLPDLKTMKEIALKIFEVFEDIWDNQSLTIISMKIECGYTLTTNSDGQSIPSEIVISEILEIDDES